MIVDVGNAVNTQVQSSGSGGVCIYWNNRDQGYNEVGEGAGGV